MHPALPLWFELVSLGVVVLVLAADLLLAVRRPRVPSPAESAAWVGVYVGLALLFALGVLLTSGGALAGQFVAGWLTEYSLSIDNLFVFVIIMARFAVPRQAQQQALMVGIILALVFRGVFILIGARLIESFGWVFYLFGAFLLYTAVKQALDRPGREDDADASEGAFARFLRRRLRVTDRYDGARLRTTIDGQRLFTPLIVVFAALGSTDVLFALDSIPAIFGITTSAFLVFAANVFALMGLRQLYFLLGRLLERLEYLRYGIAVVLAFIGVKLVLHALHENTLPFVAGGRPVAWAPEIGTPVSLAVIVAAMALATLASLLTRRR